MKFKFNLFGLALGYKDKRSLKVIVEMPKSVFAVQLTKRMKEKGVNQTILAKKTGIPLSRLRPWFIDDKNRKPVLPNVIDLLAVANFFETTIEELLLPIPHFTNDEAIGWMRDNYPQLDDNQKQQLTYFIKELF